MAFCTNCGRPLQDGEVCLCRSEAQPQVTPVVPVQVASAQTATTPVQAALFSAATAPVQAAVIDQPAQPNAFAIFFKGIWAFVIGVLKAPVTTINAYVEKADAKIACTLIGISALVAALVRCFELLQANSKAAVYPDYSYLLGGTTNSGGYIFKQMCLSALFIIAAAAVVALVVMVAVNVIGKAKATYVQGIAIASLSAILTIPAALLAYFFGLFGVSFFSELGGWISLFASAVGAIYIFYGVRVVCKDENKLPYIAGLCAIGASIAIYLIGLMF